MTDHNYQSFFNMTVESFVRPWEKYVMGMRFSEVSLFPISILMAIITIAKKTSSSSADFQLGAIRYERDVRGVANYLSTQTTFGGARDKFTRLQQISTVLNLDAVSLVLLASRHGHRLIHRTRMRMSFGRIRVFLGGSVRSSTNPCLNSGSRLISWLRAIERLEYNIYNCIKVLHMHMHLCDVYS